MNRRARVRVVALLVLMVSIICLFTLRIYKLQAALTPEARRNANALEYRTTIQAARGQILDRNGTVLVTNRPSYNLMIISHVFRAGPHPNESLLNLIHTCDELGLELTHHFPVTETRPYEYTIDALPYNWQQHFRSFLKSRSIDSDVQPGHFMKILAKAYNLSDDLSDEDFYRMIAIRYELDLRGIDDMPLDNYVLAYDVSPTDLAAIIELDIPGIVVGISTEREYKTKYGAQMLGYTTKMDREMYEGKYKELGYNMNADVGFTGVEYAFEEYLHGTDGLMKTTVTPTGEILDQHYLSVPEPGGNVELTIDWNIQKAAEDALEEHILNLRAVGVDEEHHGDDVKGGAVVVMDPNTGEVLACASYPTYDPNRFEELYPQLAADDKYYPLVNRALNLPFPPGSIYKMCTGIAAIDYAGASRWEQITDEGQYTKFADQGYVPACHIWRSRGTTHGTINMMQAIAVSCNFYFYEMGLRVSTKDLDYVAAKMGLGEPTGVELPEAIGRRANADTKAEEFAGTSQASWVEGDKLQAAIGQSLNAFTPMQMAVYCSTLATGGTRYNATFLRRVVSWDYKDLLVQGKHTVADKIDLSDEALAMVREGMKMTAQKGNTAHLFADANYPIQVAAKTGTAQHGSGKESDNGSLLCYAPADNPKVAIAIYVENGSSGGSLAPIAMNVLDAYFSQTGKYELVYDENEVR